MQITIDPDVLKELEYVVKLHAEHGAPNPMGSVEDLVAFVLASIADGSRRPGSWERELLLPLGLVAETPLHGQYRAQYGEPESTSPSPDASQP